MEKQRTNYEKIEEAMQRLLEAAKQIDDAELEDVVGDFERTANIMIFLAQIAQSKKHDN